MIWQNHKECIWSILSKHYPQIIEFTAKIPISAHFRPISQAKPQCNTCYNGLYQRRNPSDTLEQLWKPCADRERDREEHKPQT